MCDNAAVTKDVPNIRDYSVAGETNIMGSKGNKYCSDCSLLLEENTHFLKASITFICLERL